MGRETSTLYKLASFHSVLQLCIPALVHLVLPQDLDERRSLFSLEEKGPIRTTFLNFTLHYLLLPYR